MVQSAGVKLGLAWRIRLRGGKGLVACAPRAFADPFASVAHPSPPFGVRGGVARASGAGVGGQRSHGWRSAADFRVSERPGGPQRTSGDGAWAAPDLERFPSFGVPPAAGRQKSRRMRSSSVRRPLRLRHPRAGGVLATACKPVARKRRSSGIVASRKRLETAKSAK